MPDPARNVTSKTVVLLVTAIAPFIFTFMSSAVNIALPSMSTELSLDAIMQGWIATSYLLSSAALLVPFGRVADIHGRKRIFTYGAIIFTLSSLFSALARSSAILIACRVLQGIGGSMVTATAAALLITAFPANERGKVLGINIAAVYLGLSLGPVLGGILTHHLGWRSIFLLATFLGCVVIGLLSVKVKGEWTGAKGERFDFVGSVVYILGLVALVYGFTLLQESSEMRLGVGLIIGGAIGLALFVRWEMRITSPVLDMNLFKNNRAFTFSNLAALINYSATFAVSFLMSLYLQYLKGFNAQDAGLILVAMPAMQSGFSPLAGRLSDKIEPRLIASAGMGLTTAGLIALTFLNAETPLALIVGSLILIGLGLALFASPNTNAVMSSAPRTAYGLASGILGTMRQIGMVFSMGVTMMIFALYIGPVQIAPEHYPLFQKSMHTCFMIFAGLCLAGIFASLARGKLR